MATAASLESITLGRGSVRLHAVASGPPCGPVVLLLHGFPEFWYGWRHQIPALASAGFRVIAPDQRGYNRSDKPAGVRAYRLSELTADVVAMADQLGQESIYIAGHDWGGAVAWDLGIRHPGRVRRMCIINMPHPAVLARRLKRNPLQMLRSWYMLFFQIPKAPEALLAAQNFRAMARALRRSSLPGAFTREDLDRYREAWSRPGAVTAMINWYRAAFRFRPGSRAFPSVRVPVRLLWGARDAFLGRRMAHDSLRRCSQADLTVFPHATHWVHHEEPRMVNEALIDFFRVT